MKSELVQVTGYYIRFYQTITVAQTQKCVMRVSFLSFISIGRGLLENILTNLFIFN